MDRSEFEYQARMEQKLDSIIGWINSLQQPEPKKVKKRFVPEKEELEEEEPEPEELPDEPEEEEDLEEKAEKAVVEMKEPDMKKIEKKLRKQRSRWTNP